MRVLRRLLDRDPVLHACHHPIHPGAHVLVGQLLRGEAEGNPDLRLVQPSGKQRKLKASRHHADDRIRFTVQLDGLAQDMRVAMVSVQPQCVTKERHGGVTVVFLFGEDPAQQRRNAERRKHARPQPRSADQLRRRCARELIPGRRKCAHRREGCRRALIGGDLARCYAGIGAVAEMVAHNYEPVRIGEGQGPQQNSFHH